MKVYIFLCVFVLELSVIYFPLISKDVLHFKVYILWLGFWFLASRNILLAKKPRKKSWTAALNENQIKKQRIERYYTLLKQFLSFLLTDIILLYFKLKSKNLLSFSLSKQKLKLSFFRISFYLFLTISSNCYLFIVSLLRISRHGNACRTHTNTRTCDVGMPVCIGACGEERESVGNRPVVN